MPRLDDTFIVRLPKDLHDRLRERAAAEERSVASVIRLLVRTWVDQEPVQPVLRPDHSGTPAADHAGHDA